MSDHEQVDSPDVEPPSWELPNENEVIADISARSFSVWRVFGAVGVAMLLITPALYMLDSAGYLGEPEHRSDSLGSGRRTTAREFDLGNAAIPVDEIRSGGPSKDGIPAISDPKMIAATEADYLKPTDRVIGIVIGDVARAYPLAILNYHEIINDQLGEQPVAVSYCPLCDSVSAFDRTTSGGVREFGVSGLLYNSNVLMYDRTDSSESLWSQLKRESVAGPQVRAQLRLLPVELATWAEWQARHPSTTVMSNETGHPRDYTSTPYGRYFSSDSLMFPVDNADDRLPKKQRVLGVLVDGRSRAYPRSAFGEQTTRIEDELGGKRIVIDFSPDSESLRVVEADEGVTWMYSFWFAWYAMYPETSVYQHSQ